MEVDQKHITTIRMHETKGTSITLKKCDADYQLKLSSEQHVVNVTLSLNDVRKLCHELVQADVEENFRGHVAPPTPEYRSLFFRTAPPKAQDSMADVFAQAAREVFERRFTPAYAGTNGDS